MRKTSALVISFSLLASLLIAAEPRQPKISGIYSNLAYNDESGDLLGMEVMLIPVGEGWSAVVEVSEGAPATPVVVPAKVKGTKVEFQLPEAAGGQKFVGSVTSNSLVGTFGMEKVTLPRGKSYWQ